MNRDRWREIASLGQWSLGFFLAAAMLTYREVLPPGEPPALANVCGEVGRVTAAFLLGNFGFASYLGVLWLFVEGLRSFRREVTGPVLPRIPGWIVFGVAAAAGLSHLFPGGSESIPDPGGEVGMALESLLLDGAGLGGFGGRVTLGFLLLTSFVLASGILYSQWFTSAMEWWDDRGGAIGVLGFRSPRVATQPAVAVVEGGAAGVAEVDETEVEDDGWEDDTESEWESEEEVDAAVATEDVEETEAEEATADDPDRDPWDEDWQETDWETESVEAAVSDDDEAESSEEWASTEADVANPDDVEVWDVVEEDADDDDEDPEAESDEAFESATESDTGWNDEGWDTSAETGEVTEEESDGEDDLGEEASLPPVFSHDEVEAQLHSEVDAEDSGEDPAEELEGAEDFDSDESWESEAEETAEEDDRPVRYVFPPLALLAEKPAVDQEGLERTTHETARKLTSVLASFKIEARVVGVSRGPSIKMFEIELAPGTKLGRLRGLEDDLAMNLAAQSVRIVAPIPGRATAGIELPNDEREVVTLRELVEWPRYNDGKYALPFFLGKGSAGQPLVADLAAMPHLLVAGATGAGKSVCLNTMIMSIVFKRTPEQVKMILIDPKMVELSLFKDIPHLMCPVVTDMKRAAGILEWAVEKMESRYHLLHEVGVRNIQAYNRLGPTKIAERLGQEEGSIEGHLPFVVIVIDELADLMMVAAKDVEQSITRLAQKSRAVGIHVILATQRPSTNVITGLIKANLPTRIAFRVASKIDSRVILDTNGAEKLLGAGDMLYLAPKAAEVARVQGTFIDDDEIHDVMSHVAANSKPNYSKELMQKRSKTDQDPSEVDELFDDAARFVVETKRGSASLLQRRYQIGYTRASRLIDLMANEGYLGEYRGSQAREVLVTIEELDKQRAEAIAKLHQGKKKGGPSGPTLYDSEGD